jgi:hypothetical protein
MMGQIFLRNVTDRATSGDSVSIAKVWHVCQMCAAVVDGRLTAHIIASFVSTTTPQMGVERGCESPVFACIPL